MRRLRWELYMVMFSNPALLGMKYIHVPRKNVEVVLCSDAAIAVNKDKPSQLNILVMFWNVHYGSPNIVHYISSKSECVSKSVLSPELSAMVPRFDVGFAAAHLLGEMFDWTVLLPLCKDVRSLYGLCIPLWQTTECCLKMHLSQTREAYDNRMITEIVRLAGNFNLAGDVTKKRSAEEC